MPNMETVSPGTEVVNPIPNITYYLDVVSTSDDAGQVLGIDQLAHNGFNTDTPTLRSWERDTRHVAYAIEHGSPDAVNERVAAIQGVVRGMIQGNNRFPAERFGEIIDLAVAAMQKVSPNISSRRARKFIRNEIKDVWQPFALQAAEEFERAAEAYKLVSEPRDYKLTRVKMAIARKFSGHAAN